MSSSAREEILEAIRSALSDRAELGSVEIQQEYEALPRKYAQAPDLAPERVLDLLEERLHDYDAEVTRVAEPEVASAISIILAANGISAALVPADFPARWRPASATMVEDHDFPAPALDQFEAVVTTASLAIADTGTFVLQATHGQGRRAASLVPDFHLCVLHAGDVVQTVPEAFAHLQATATLPTTFVSGPSATADIEMTRIKGVHGPRSLHVLLVCSGNADAPLATHTLTS